MLSLYATTVGLIALLGALSIVLLGITAHLLAWMTQHSSQTFTWTDQSNNNYDFYWVPEHNLTRSYILLLTTGCLCTIISLTSLLAFLRPSIVSRYTPRRVTPTPILAACTALGALLILSALALTFADNARNPAFLPCAGEWQSCDEATGPLHPAFTIEGWACPLSLSPSYLGGGGGGGGSINGLVLAELNGICTEAKVARWWTLPLLLVELCVIVCGLMMIRSRNVKRRDSRFEKEFQAWGEGGDNLPRPASSHSAAPTYQSQDPTREEEQNTQLFTPISPINHSKQASADLLSSPVSQIDKNAQDAAPRYENLNTVVHEADAHTNQVHEVDGISQRPSRLPANRTGLLSELPGEKPIR